MSYYGAEAPEPAAIAAFVKEEKMQFETMRRLCSSSPAPKDSAESLTQHLRSNSANQSKWFPTSSNLRTENNSYDYTDGFSLSPNQHLSDPFLLATFSRTSSTSPKISEHISLQPETVNESVHSWSLEGIFDAPERPYYAQYQYQRNRGQTNSHLQAVNELIRENKKRFPESNKVGSDREDLSVNSKVSQDVLGIGMQTKHTECIERESSQATFSSFNPMSYLASNIGDDEDLELHDILKMSLNNDVDLNNGSKKAAFSSPPPMKRISSNDEISADFSNENAKLPAQNFQQKKDSQDMLGNNINRFTAVTDRSRKSVLELEKELAGAKSLLRSEKHKYSLMENQYQEKCIEAERSKAEVACLRDKMNSLTSDHKDEINRRQIEIDESFIERGKLKSKLDEMAQTLEGLKILENRYMRSENVLLNCRLNENKAKAQQESAEIKVAELESHVAQLKENADKANGTIENLRATLVGNDLQHKRILSELQRTKELNATLEEKISENEAVFNAQESQQMKTSIDMFNRKIHELSEKLNLSINKYDALANKFMVMENALAYAEEGQATAKAVVQQLRLELESERQHKNKSQTGTVPDARIMSNGNFTMERSTMQNQKRERRKDNAVQNLETNPMPEPRHIRKLDSNAIDEARCLLLNTINIPEYGIQNQMYFGRMPSSILSPPLDLSSDSGPEDHISVHVPRNGIRQGLEPKIPVLHNMGNNRNIDNPNLNWVNKTVQAAYDRILAPADIKHTAFAKINNLKDRAIPPSAVHSKVSAELKESTNLKGAKSGTSKIMQKKTGTAVQAKRKVENSRNITGTQRGRDTEVRRSNLGRSRPTNLGVTRGTISSLSRERNRRNLSLQSSEAKKYWRK